MEWVSDFVIKRRANRTNVYIVETMDFRRLWGFIIQLARRTIHELLQWSFDSYIYDLQRKTLEKIVEFSEDRGLITMEVKQEDKGLFGAGSLATIDVLKQLDSILHNSPSLVVISYVFEKRHADYLADYLMAWSQDEKLYDHGENVEESSTVVVFTSNAELFPVALLNSSYVITIPPSTEEERRELLRRMAERYEEEKGVKLAVTEELIKATSGLNLQDVQSAAQESLLKYGKFDLSVFTDYKLRILRNYGLYYIEPKRGFESIGGYKYLKEYIKNNIILPLKHPKIAEKYGIKPPKGILLYGPPGTGKTWLTKALAREIGLCVLALNPADFFRSLVGESEARVRQIQTIVESIAPCIVLFDEYDQIAMPRSQLVSSEVSRRVANMMLEWFGEERKSIIVGTTNFNPNELDEAFIRPGRIDWIVPVLPPDLEARKDILRVHTEIVRKVPLKNVDFNEIARKTYLFTGAELEALVLQAARLAFVERSEAVKQDHFEEALKTVVINVSEREKMLWEMIESLKKLKTGNVDQGFLMEAVKAFARREGKRDRFDKFLARI